jgi:fucose 4-O-acetylase-like acetyltransferase
MNKRITYIDTAKGILILLMLIGHIWNDGFVHDFIYVFHMPAFFLISGMVSSSKELSVRGFGTFILSRVQTLLVPYLCFELFAISADMICNGIYLNVKGYAYQILTLRLFNGPLWFLIVMFLSGLIFFFLQGLQSRSLKSASMMVLLLLVMIMPQYHAYISPSTITLALFYMVVGSCISTSVEKASLKWWHIPLLLGITTLISFADIGEMPDYQSGSRVLFLLGSLIGTALILAVSQRFDHKVLQFFGRNSLVILGSHYPIIRLTKYFLQFEAFSAIGGILFFVVLVLLEVLIILFVNRFLPFAAGKGLLRKRNMQEVAK